MPSPPVSIAAVDSVKELFRDAPIDARTNVHTDEFSSVAVEFPSDCWLWAVSEIVDSFWIDFAL